MEKSVRNFFFITIVLLGFGGTVHAQPEVLKNVPANSTNFVEIGDFVFFTAGNTLWRTDGTSAGTIQLKSSLPTTPFSFREFKGYALFLTGASNPALDEGPTQLWRTDGTPGGTIQLLTKDYIGLEQSNGNFYFFYAKDATTGQELYRTDGTPSGTVMLKDIYPGATNGYRGSAGVVGNLLIFSASNGTNGIELWRSDGTTAGTVMIKDINPGPDFSIAGNSNTLVHNGLYYFRVKTPEHGAEPWVSDGTATGTRLLKDMVPGPDDPGVLHFAIGHDNTVYFLDLQFSGDSGAGHLWKTSGTESSTVFVKTLGDDSQHEYHSFRVYHDKVYFFDRVDFFSDRLWVTDGTAAGTNTFFSLITIDGGISFFEVINDYLVFTANTQNIPYNLYRSDGTADGTKVYAQFNARGHGVYPRDLTKVGDLLFYGDHEGLTEQAAGFPHSSEDYYHLFQSDAITTQSIRTLWGINTIGTDNITGLNNKVIFTTQDDQFGSVDTQKRIWLYDPAETPPPTASFTLVNAGNDKDLRRLLDGASISNPYDAALNIRYNPVGTPGSVVFKLNGTPVRTETAAPYSLAGDVNGDYAPWQGADAGTYTLTATPYSQAGGQGTAGPSLTITFTIECESDDEGCTPTGEILHERWNNVAGNDVAAIPVNEDPDTRRYIGKFEAPENAGTNYGARIRGYVIPPATGNYIFWIASNDHSELWLSTNDQPANKRKIAYVTGATNSRQWDKFPTQKSVAIRLEGGQKYYVEALHKQGAGTDHIAVGWQLPDGTMERPIPGNRLAPFVPGPSTSPTVTITHPTNGQTFTAPADVRIDADASDGDDGTITRVRFYGATGEAATMLFEDTSAPYSFVWEDLPLGTYNVYAEATDGDGNVVNSHDVYFYVHPGSECTASGTITRDYWSNVSGATVSDVPVDREPTSTNELTIFEGPSNIGTNYATRIRGYICPPATGDYRFYIASNDNSELWLSTDDDPANRQKIAWVTTATNPRQWNKSSSQVSAAIRLTQGQRYYIEALHKQGAGTDHIAVGWQLPDGSLERPVPGMRLSPFETNAMMAAETLSASANNDAYARIGVYPNPLQSSDAQLSIAGYEGIEEIVETEVQILKLTGEAVFADKIVCGGDCSSYLLNIREQLVPGLYMVNMKTNGVRYSKRLLVK